MTIEEISKAVEKVSKGYTEHFGLKRDGHWFLLRLQDEIGELTHAYLKMTGVALKKGKTDEEIKQNIAEEIADVVAHTLLLAQHTGVDIEQALKDKWLKFLPKE